MISWFKRPPSLLEAQSDDSSNPLPLGDRFRASSIPNGGIHEKTISQSIRQLCLAPLKLRPREKGISP